jgi:uncharacterized phiE125 gp8 family phage protein
MAHKLITAPTLLSLISLAELRQHCKLDVDGSGTHPDDSLLQIYLAAAHQHAEHHTGTAIGAQVVELALDDFPAGPILLAPGPVSSVTSLKYLDTAGVEQTLSAGAYTLDEYANPAWLIQAYGTLWPAPLDAANAVKVRYTAGSNTIAPALKAALLLMVGHLYANREGAAPGSLAQIPLGVASLLDTVRDWSR